MPPAAGQRVSHALHVLLLVAVAVCAQEQHQDVQVQGIMASHSVRAYAACASDAELDCEDHPSVVPAASRSGCPHGYGFNPGAPYATAATAQGASLTEAGTAPKHTDKTNPPDKTAKPKPGFGFFGFRKASAGTTTAATKSPGSGSSGASAQKRKLPSSASATRAPAPPHAETKPSATHLRAQAERLHDNVRYPETAEDRGEYRSRPDDRGDRSESEREHTFSGSCELCPPGWYSPGGDSPCLPCSLPPGGFGFDPRRQSEYAQATAGFTTSKGADREELCRCAPGFGGKECRRCPVGTASTGGRYSSCQPCNTNQIPTPNRDACQCQLGTGLDPSTGQCKKCTIGTFWEGVTAKDGGYGYTIGSSALQPCVSCLQLFEDGSAATTASEGATSPKQCICSPGFGGEDCSICEAGTYSIGGTFSEPRKPCQKCPATVWSTTPGARNVSECGQEGCRPGHGGQYCAKCPPGTWSAGGTLDPCQECGQFQLSGWGSTSRGACECIAGHGYNSTDPASAVCEPCPLGTFYVGPEDTERPYSRSYGAKSANTKIQGAGFADGRDGLTDASRRRGICVECSTVLRGGVTTLLTGARSPKECVCSPGFGGRDCERCDPEFYSPGGNTGDPQADCTRCPKGFIGSQDKGAASLADCGGCQPGRGGESCDVCDPGTFSAGGSNSECTPCGPNQVSPPGSTSNGACQCAKGLGIPSTGQDCSVCPAGTFWPGPRDTYDSFDSPKSDGYAAAGANVKTEAGAVQAKVEYYPEVSEPGVQPCINCSAVISGSVTTLSEGSTSIHDCVCNPGHGGEDCRICQTGEYSPGGSGYEPRPECARCPKNHRGSQTPGATGVSECGGCEAGFGGRDCLECSENTFSEGGNYDACEPCGRNQKSPVGSRSRDMCECQAGHGRITGASDSCDVCGVGSFWPGFEAERGHYGDYGLDPDRYAEDASMQRLPGKAGVMGVNRPGVRACINCSEALQGGSSTTLDVGATSVKQCVCNPGYGGELCTICEPGRFSPGGTEYEPRADCKRCSPTSRGSQLPGAKSAAECGGCDAGFGGEDCERCPEGTFSLGGTTDPCTPCGLHQTTSTPGATSRSFCQCQPGYGTNATRTSGCNICPVGFFWPGFDLRYSSMEDSYGPKRRDDDREDSGIYSQKLLATMQQVWMSLPGPSKSNLNAREREQPYGAGLRECISCADALPEGSSGTTLDVGSNSVRDCLCSPGYGGPLCTICQPGSYSPGGNMHESRPECRRCPADTLGAQQPGAKDIAECGGCELGTGGKDCNVCPPNTYSEGGSYEACVSCGANQVSPKGSKSRDFCECIAGYGTNATRTDGCNLCPVGTFWHAGSKPHYRQHLGDSYGSDSSYPRYESDQAYDQYAGEARIQRLGPNSALSGPAGVRPCISCSEVFPDGSSTTLDVGSSSSKDCVCNPGYGGPMCMQCEVGTFSPGGDDYELRPECRKCPDNRMGAVAGATGVAGCGGCEPGRGGLDCEICQANTYSLGGTFGPCVSCGANQVSPKGSTSQKFCECSAGYGTNESRTDGCNLCPIGAFWPGVQPEDGNRSPYDERMYGDDGRDDWRMPYELFPGQARIQQTGTAAFVSPGPQGVRPCINCSDILPLGSSTTLNVGSDSAQDCVCNPGYGGQFCNICPPGTWSAGGTQDDPRCDCKPCPKNMLGSPVAGATNETACGGCEPGRGGIGCETCPESTYSLGGTYDECTSCGPNAISPPGSTSALFCACRAGNGLNAQSNCSTCPVGTFSLGPLGHDPDYPIRKGYGLEGPFQLGFEHTKSLRDPSGSSDDTEYSYDTGRQLLTRRPAAADVTPAKTAVAVSSKMAEGTASAKTGVAVAQYQGYDYGDDDLKEWPQTGLLACVNCSAVLGDRDAITLEPGADSPRDCICSPGHGGKYCELCPAGTWSPGGTFSDYRPKCRHCPPHTIGSVYGAGSQEECGGCKPGFGGRDCEKCEENTYSTGSTYDPCRPCGTNAVSPPGSTNADFCVCTAGNGLDARGNCSTCPLGTFSEGPFGHDGDQPYHDPDADYGANGPFQIGFGSSEPRNSYEYGRALLAENVADSKATTSQFNDGYYGMEKQSTWIRTGFLRCVNCTAVLADSDSTTLETGSDSPKDCICSPGHGGKFCELCKAGTYSPGGTFSDYRPKCIHCPPNFIGSLPGAGSLAECGGCKPGYGGPDCEECPENTFSAGGTNNPCEPCGPNQVSPACSKSQLYCKCIEGFGANETLDCEICPIGEFAPAPKFPPHHHLDHHMDKDYNEHQGLSYAGGRDNDAYSNYDSSSWYRRPFDDRDGLPDQHDDVSDSYDSYRDRRDGYDDDRHDRYGADERGVRGYGSYGSSWDEFALNGVQPCFNCSIAVSPGSTTLQPGSNNIHDCVCLPGFGGHDCEICQPGFYGEGGTADDPRPECKACPPHFVGSLVAGADNITDCGGCVPGFVLVGEHCKPCEHDTFSVGGNETECTPCGFNQASPPKSPSREYCQCIVGNGDDGTGNCTTCPLGTFWAGPEKLRFRQEGRDEQSRRFADGYNSYNSYSSSHDSYYGYSDSQDEYMGDGYSPYNGYQSGRGHHKNARIGDLGPPPGVQPCTNCSIVFPAGGSTTLTQGSASSKDCVCAPGYGGYRCLICEPGWWGPGGDEHDPTRDCKRCPENSLGSPEPGASDKWDCGGCVPGFGGIHCDRCPPNTFSEGGNYTACVPCGKNQLSPPASPGRDYCECAPGFGLQDGECKLCPLGSFSTIPHFHSHFGGHGAHGHQHERARGGLSIAALANASGAQRAKIMEALACVSCDDRFPGGDFTTIAPGASSPEQCVCAAGHGGVFCQECLEGTWSPGGTTAECRTCPGGPSATTPDPGATSPTQCTCESGHGGSNCEQCPPGTWSTGGVDPCTPCDPGQVSPPGASDEAQCTDCPVGTTPVNGVCKACGLGTTTLAEGSAFCDACSPGFGVEQGATQCTPCPPGTWAAGAGLLPCSLCPVGMSSAAGTSAEASCFCNTPGWGALVPDGPSCSPCPVGYYSSQIRGRFTCEPCEAGFTTLHEKSGSITDCVCAAGYGSTDGYTQECQPCISPYYQGILTDYLVPITGATKSNPFPACVYCSGTIMEIDPATQEPLIPPLQATGDINKLCTATDFPGAGNPSAYCAVANISALYDTFTLSDPTKVPSCGPTLIQQRFSFISSMAQRFVLPNNIISLSAELAGGAGAPGFRCQGGTCKAATSGGPGGVLNIQNLETVVKGGEEVFILVGGAAPTPEFPSQPVAGGGGGYSAILSASNPSAASTVWYAAAGGGGGGAGSPCLPNGVCVGGAGEGGCMSGVMRVNRTLAGVRPAAKGGASGIGIVLNSTDTRSAASANGLPGGSAGGGLGGGVDARAAGLAVAGFGGGGGGWGQLGAEGFGGFGGGGGGGGAPSAGAPGVTLAPGGGGGGGWWAGAGGDNTVIGSVAGADMTRVGRGGGGGNCIVVGSAPGTNAQLIKGSSLASGNTGNGYVQLTIVYTK